MILPEFRLILECCKGEASVGDAIKMKKNELLDILYSPEYNIIVDFQEFETFLDSTINESITNFFNFLKGLDINSKIAFLTAEPHQVVISMILKELSTNLGAIKIEVFSTAEAAIRFLGLPIENFDLINNKIIELNKNTA
jgi:archaellum biogenesis ATPase FlaH